MRSQNIKYKTSSSGKVIGISCLSLLLLTFLAINPFIKLSAYAEELNSENADEQDGSSDGANYDDQVSTLSETSSTVSIAFLPTSASGSVTPVNSGGDKAKVDVKATVRVQNSGGYSVYLGSSSSQLTSGANTIDSVSSATTYANLPVNTWGYAFLKNGASSNDNTTYSAMPATLRSTALDANASTSITDETRTYTLSFAANIGNDKPAGTYTNSVTMSVVSSPLIVAEEFAYDFGGITTMQAMTSAICDTAPTGGVKQLQDTRDGKYYWIGKMKDGKCWMTQNLDLDLNEKTLPLTSATSDVSADWTPMDGEKVLYTANVVNQSTFNHEVTGQGSWDVGSYSLVDPSSYVICGNGLESAAACAGIGTKDRVRYYATPITANNDTNAHYILGNFYQWNAATAGTGGTMTNGQASGSICPKGWKLPISNTDTAGSFDRLLSEYFIDNNPAGVDKIINAPLYFVKSGHVTNDVKYAFDNAGGAGRYWSSTPSDSGKTFNLGFWYDTVISSSVDSRQYGFSVRCIAK